MSVGSTNLPNHKAEFTLILVGESGVGESTLVKSLFSAYIYCLKPSERLKPTVAVETNTVLLRDNLKLPIVDARLRRRG